MTRSECPECGAALPVAARFCAACGHALTASVPAESERRQLTVLFCDIVESTALSDRLDAEDWHDLLTAYHQACREVIGRFEGRVSQFLGDGIMAYFGHPIAHEDDAVRAVRAALRIIEDLKLINQGIGKRLGAELHVRAGLHTGDAVLGDAGSSGERLAIGKSVNLAARIQSLASVDTVVLSESTAQLVTGYFELQSLGAATLRGFVSPVALFQVVRATDVRSRLEAAALGRLTPYVGRERELEELAALWRKAERGEGPVVVVRGEAGIGKSRMLRQFRDVVLEQGARVVECLCSPLAQATALAPIIEMLNARILERTHGKTGSEQKLVALEEMLGAHSRLGRDAVALMAAALSISGADEGVLADMSPVRRRARTLEIMRDWLGSSAERMPVTLLVEDAHWADPSTLDLLDLLVREDPRGRSLVCVTCRPEFRDRWTGDHVYSVELGRLQDVELEAMIAQVAGGNGLPPLVARRIAERSEGVPLFVEELTKAVLESGALQLDGNQKLAAGASDAQFMPSTVQGSLLARFDRLGESRSIAQLGAAIGREFSHALISAVAQLPEEQLHAHLARLEQSEMVYVQREPTGARYTFRHALIQDAIYATMLRGERSRVHERILTTLEQQFPELVAERPENIAYHAESAGRREVAIPLLLAAGQKALQRTAVAEAVKHLKHAVELVHVLEEPERTNVEIELQAALGPAYMATVGWASVEVEQSCARLRDLVASRGDVDRLYVAMWGLWTVYFLRGELDRALDAARQVDSMARQTADPMLWLTAHHALGYTHFYRGEYARAIAHADEGLALFDLEREQRIVGLFQFSSSCALWIFRAQSQQMLGLLEEATESLRHAQELNDQLGHAPVRAYGLNACFCLRMAGALEEIKPRASAARMLCLSEGFHFWALVSEIILAWTDAHRGGEPNAAAGRIEFARNLLHDSGACIVEPEFATMHAETLLLAERPTEAVRVADEALVLVARGNQRHGEPELYRVQGDAAKATKDHELAASLYRRGVDTARAMGARLLELRSALALAGLVGVTAIRPELLTIVDGFTQGFAHPDFRRALALLGRPMPDAALG